MAGRVKISKFTTTYLNATQRRAQRISEAFKKKLQLDANFNEAKSVNEKNAIAKQLLVIIGDDGIPNTLRYYISKYLIIVRKIQEMSAEGFQKEIEEEAQRIWSGELFFIRHYTNMLAAAYEKIHVQLSIQAQAIHEIETGNAEGLKHYYDAAEDERKTRSMLCNTVEENARQYLRRLVEKQEDLRKIINEEDTKRRLESAGKQFDELMRKNPELQLSYNNQQRQIYILAMKASAWKCGFLGIGAAVLLLGVSAMQVTPLTSLTTIVAGVGSAVVGLAGMLDWFQEAKIARNSSLQAIERRIEQGRNQEEVIADRILLF